jgi:molecular chaperone GrpE
MEETKPVAEAGAEPEATQAADAAEPVTLETVAAERDRLAEEIASLNDRLLRRQAEFENFRKRVDRERSEFLEYASTEAVRALLPVLDDFERALKVETADRDYAKGMELIYQRLRDNLIKLGLEPISTVGETFDPNLHHAIQKEETEDAEDHTILEEYQRGYNLRGRLLRPAWVKVAVRKA